MDVPRPRLCAIEGTFAQLGKECGTGSEKLIEGDRQAHRGFKLQMLLVDREAEKENALSTIKINYLDLRYAALSRNRRSYSYLFDQVFFSFAHKIAAA